MEQIWNEKGQLVDEGSYYLGAPIGLHRHWYEDGSLRARLFYYSSKRVDKQAYNRAGELIFEGLTSDGGQVKETHWIDGEIVKPI